MPCLLCCWHFSLVYLLQSNAGFHSLSFQTSHTPCHKDYPWCWQPDLPSHSYLTHCPYRASAFFWYSWAVDQFITILEEHRIWEDDSHFSDKCVRQDFCLGFNAVDNVPVIKGTHADACILPFSTLLQALSQLPTDVHMPLNCLAVDHRQWDAMFILPHPAMKETVQHEVQAVSLVSIT